MKRLALISGVLLAIMLVACQDSTPAPTSTPAPEPTASPEPTETPAVSADAAAIAMLEEAAGALSAETEACLTDLLEDDPSIAQSFAAEEELSGPSLLSVIACLTPEEAAALTPPGEGPAPDAAGLACLSEELEGAPERDRILAVLSGDDPSGDGLTPEQSAVLGQAVDGCGIDTGFGFPAAAGDEEHPLAGTEWRLVALGDADAPAPVAGGDPTARFTTDRDLTGWTGCNAYGAGYRVQGSELRLDGLSWQEAGCPSDALFQQEQRIQDALATIERFEISGNRLMLHSEAGQALVFERVGE